MILLGMIGITVLLSVFVSNYLIDQKKQVLKDNCLAVCNVISDLDGSNISEENSLSIIRTMASITEADIFIVNVEGKVLMCSCDEWAVDGLCGHNGSVVSKKIMQKVEKADFNEVGELGGLYSQVQFTYASSLKNSKNRPYFCKQFAAAVIIRDIDFPMLLIAQKMTLAYKKQSQTFESREIKPPIPK